MTDVRIWEWPRLSEKVARNICTDRGMNPDDIIKTPQGKPYRNWECFLTEAESAMRTLGYRVTPAE